MTFTPQTAAEIRLNLDQFISCCERNSNIAIIESKSCTQKLLSIGEPVLFYIFKNNTLGSNSIADGPLMGIMSRIARHDPVSPTHRGQVKLMIKDWQDWFEENGYQD